MTKSMRSVLVGAALAGFLAGTTAIAQDTSSSSGAQSTPDTTQSTPGAGTTGKKSHKKAKMEKHACKGQNSCKGMGGCGSSDNGCKGKNSCKGKGGCATDGSPMPK